MCTIRECQGTMGYTTPYISLIFHMRFPCMLISRIKENQGQGLMDDTSFLIKLAYLVWISVVE